jgi:hypothetical protein
LNKENNLKNIANGTVSPRKLPDNCKKYAKKALSQEMSKICRKALPIKR